MQKQTEFEAEKLKIVNGLKLAYQKLIEQKRRSNSLLVVMRKGKIVLLTAEEME